MNKRELDFILQEGEGFEIEFKESLKNIDREVVALANAIREAVINSVMHKNYFEHGHNNILKFFPNRIQIENVWIKPKNFVLGKTVFRRNKIIADLFSRIHLGEKLGSGMERMRLYCKKERAPSPRIELTDNYFYIIFKPSKAYMDIAGEVDAKVDARVDANLTRRERKIFRFNIENGRISSSQLQKMFNVSREMANKYFRSLIAKNLITKKGIGKSTHYVLKDKKQWRAAG